MSQIIVLASDENIDGVVRVAGEVVTVPDGFNPAKIRRILRSQSEETDQRTNEFFRIGLNKLQAILQADYPQFWTALEKRPALQNKIIRRLRDEPKFLRAALDNPGEFVKIVTEQFEKQAGQPRAAGEAADA